MIEVTILPRQKSYLLIRGVVTVMLQAGQEELLPLVKVPRSKELASGRLR